MAQVVEKLIVVTSELSWSVDCHVIEEFGDFDFDERINQTNKETNNKRQRREKS